MIAYRVWTTYRTKVSAPLQAAQVTRRFRLLFSARAVGPYVARMNGHRLQVGLSLRAARSWLAEVLPQMDPGEQADLEDSKDAHFHVHAVNAWPVPIDTVPGTLNVRRWVTILAERWPNARLAGTCVCKDDSTSHCNGHRDCAAVDWFDEWAEMKASGEFAIAHADELGLSYTILGDDIWTYGPPRTDSSRGHHHYTGEYHYHRHMSFCDGVCGLACAPRSEWARKGCEGG